ncbi:hypothetical protein OF83DRAFT_1084918 [Amylostereum chailletii]|nr:hypothetical protein OF83DRAFT_1084918 [Amylostereum chailletii]
MAASTRSKTGKLPRTSKRKPTTASNDSDSDDSGSERATQKVTKGRAQPPKKRVKTNNAAPTATGSSTQDTTRRKKGKLSNLPGMPLDILRDIFAFLPPEDLVRISRVTKEFRQVLLSKAFDGLWRESFENVRDSPPRPSDVSHRVWANIVYGGPFCHCCGRYTPAKITFEFRKRMCSDCVKTQLERTSLIDYPERFRSYTGKLVDVHSVVPVIKSPWHNGQMVCEGSVIEAVFDRLLAQSEDVAKADLKAKVTSLVDVEKKAMDVYNEHVKKCNEWQDRLLQEIKDERQSIADERQADILDRFIEMGYTEAEWDESRLYSHKEVNPTLQETREKLLRKEHEARREKRQSVAAKMYPGLLASLVHPTEFPLMPTWDQCLTIKFVTDFLDVDAEVDDEWRAKAKKMFEATVELVREDILAQKKQLVVLLPRPDGLSSEDAEVSTSILNATGVETLALARSVFRVVYHLDGHLFVDPYFGADVLSHASRGSLFRIPRHSEVVFYPRASESALAILRLLGLPETTTALHLDSMPVRFVCNKCSPSIECEYPSGRHIHGLDARTWRNMVFVHLPVIHVTRRHSGPVDIFRLLTEDELADILPRELGLGATKRHWCCCHCPMDEEGPYWMCKPEVLEHLKLK